jgi:hypothetical protein
MFCRFTITSSLILTNILIVAPGAWAESTEIQFSGVVPERTSVSISPTPGVPASLKIAKPLAGERFTTLHFNSTQSASVVVSDPEFVSGSHPEPKGTTRSSILKLSSDSNSSLDRTFVTIPAGEIDLQLQTLIKTPKNLAPGIYNYKTTLTIVP